MDLVLEILDDAEKAGVFTGGPDPAGNVAYVVIDSNDLIVLTVRPGGRATIIVKGEEQSYDLSDDSGEGTTQFFQDLTQALVDNNLDHKADDLANIVQNAGGEEDEDSEDDSSDDDSEDTSDDETDDTSDDESDDTSEDDSDDEDTDASDDDTADDEDAKPPKKGKNMKEQARSMGDEIASDVSLAEITDEELAQEVPLTKVEVALMLDFVPAIVESMIEHAEEQASLEEFNVNRFFRALGYAGFKADESAALAAYGDYKVGYSYDGGHNAYYVFAKEGNHNLASFKADYMVTVAAGLAKVASVIESASKNPVSHKLMRAAVKMGYTGESDTKIKLKTAKAVRETASKKLTVAEAKAEIKKVNMVLVRDGDNAWMVRPPANEATKDRIEAVECPCADLEEAVDNAKAMRAQYHKNGGKW